MKKSSMKGIFLLAVILAAVLSLFYRKTEEKGLLQTEKELEEERKRTGEEHRFVEETACRHGAAYGHFPLGKRTCGTSGK